MEGLWCQCASLSLAGMVEIFPQSRGDLVGLLRGKPQSLPSGSRAPVLFSLPVTLSYPTPTSRLLGAPQGRPCGPELSVAKSLAWTGICRGYLDVGGAERAEKFRAAWCGLWSPSNPTSAPGLSFLICKVGWYLSASCCEAVIEGC